MTTTDCPHDWTDVALTNLSKGEAAEAWAAKTIVLDPPREFRIGRWCRLCRSIEEC